jgi:hypothetical protein
MGMRRRNELARNCRKWTRPISAYNIRRVDRRDWRMPVKPRSARTPFLFLCNLTTLSASRLYSVGDRMINEYWPVGCLSNCRGNRSTRNKPALVPFCSPPIPHDLIWDPTYATAAGSRLYQWRFKQGTPWLRSWNTVHCPETLGCKLCSGYVYSAIRLRKDRTSRLSE